MTALRRVLYVLLLLPAVAHIVAFVRIVCARAAYPMDIEWLEGGELYQAYRFLHGQALYGNPDQGYLPFFHPPGHFVVLGLAGSVFGVDYTMGRIVSIVFFAAACAVVIWELLRATSRPADRLAAVLVGVAAAMASFPVVGGVYDLARNDTMALGLVLVGTALLGDGTVLRGRILGASAVFTAVAYTRLPFLFLCMAAGLFVMLRCRRNGLVLLGCTAAAGGTVLLALQLASGGWFYWLTVTLLSRHPIYASRFTEAASAVLRFAPYLAAVPMAFAIPALRRRLAPRTVLWSGLLAGALPAGLLPFAKMGGFDNDLIPIVFLAGPVAVLIALDLVPEKSRFFLLAAASVYLAWRLYDPAAFIPGPEQRARASRLNEFVAALPGDVLIPNHPLLAIRNGKKAPQFHTMPYLDIIGAGFGEGLYAYVQSSTARWAILDGREPFVRDVVMRFYDGARPVEDAVPTMVGFPSSPQILLERIEPPEKAELRVLFDFESTTLSGWRVDGDAFLAAGAAGRPAGSLAVLGSQGRGFADSYAHDRGDAATGELVSPPFAIDRAKLALLLCGGAQKRTSVQLLVDGEVAFEATGSGSLVMMPVVWDVSALRGREAQIAILDHDQTPSGHIAVDQIELFN